MPGKNICHLFATAVLKKCLNKLGERSRDKLIKLNKNSDSRQAKPVK